jgi:hypothetical protein
MPIRHALQKFYGNGFNEKRLEEKSECRGNPKKDLEDGLRQATKKTQKGDYFDNKTLARTEAAGCSQA